MLRTSSIHVVLQGEHQKGWVVGCRDVGFDAGLINIAEAMVPITWVGQYSWESNTGDKVTG